MIDNSKCIMSYPLPNLDMTKWDTIVNLLTEIFAVSCGVIIQYRHNEFNVVSTSSNKDNFLSVNSSWSWDINCFCRKTIEANGEFYVKNAVDDFQWNVTKWDIGSYLGVPLYWPNGNLFGVLCVIHKKPTDFSETLKKVLSPFRLTLECNLKYVLNVDKLLIQDEKNEQKFLAQKKDIINAKKALELQESINTAAFSSSMLAVIRISHHGTILSVNKATNILFNYNANELIGKNIRLLIAGEHDSHLSSYLSSNTPITTHKGWQIVAQQKESSVFDAMLSISEINVISEKQYVVSITDITERVKKEALLEELALYDQLTKCANRNLLNNRINLQINHAVRSGSSFSVIYIDLDKFKLVNDCFGHQCGDQVLISIGKRLRESVRKTDTVARVGGDEFIILLSEKIDNADFTKNLLNAIEAPIKTSTKTLNIQASLGLAHFSDDCKTVNELINLADSRMYSHKHKLSSSTMV